MMKSKIKSALDNIQTCSFEKLIRKIDGYDEVTFDIFDTLIKRNVPTPVSVFSIMEYDLKEPSFREKRIQAEKDARKKRGEVTLSEIYEEYPCSDIKRRQFLEQSEIDYELDLCVLNKDILPVFAYACRNKRVFLISDMYLSREVIKKILDHVGITGYEELIVSNELRMNKRSGELYDYVKKTYHCKKTLHIGNDFMSDFYKAKAKGMGAEKIRTKTYRLDREFTQFEKGAFLDSFLSNTHGKNNSYFYHFGFERFGPVLYGFINWLYDDLKKEHIEEVYFFARDGYIMQKIYMELGYDQVIPSRYLEVSRRSLRVPGYSRYSSLEEIMEETPLLSTAAMEQILDSFGLAPFEYTAVMHKYGYEPDTVLKRDSLVHDEKFHAFFEEIKDDVFQNAEKEKETLISYLKQFDFSKRVAIVDIGWGGSIQKNLLQTLDDNHIKYCVTGYYLGLSKESNLKLGRNGYRAKGYLFDCLNNEGDHDIEISFRPLFETLFLEQSGSVMKYENIHGQMTAKRYDYEYMEKGELLPEALKVKEIQQGAIDFVKKYKVSRLCNYIGNDKDVFFRYIYETGTDPDATDLSMFGDFLFFNNGAQTYLAKVGKGSHYLLHPRKYLKDLRNAQWKIGFLKRTLKIKLPYLKIYMLLHRMINHTED